jgi:hypothetical protein
MYICIFILLGNLLLKELIFIFLNIYIKKQKIEKKIKNNKNDNKK